MKKVLALLLILCLMLPGVCLADRMVVHITAVSDNAEYIGKDWASYWQLGDYQIFDGDVFDIYPGEMYLYSQITDYDSNPDVGEMYTNYNVTQNRLNKGFTVTQELAVTENAGKYRNYSATWYITWTFDPVYNYMVLH